MEELKLKVKEIIKLNKNKPNKLHETFNYLNNYSGHSFVKKEIAKNKDIE